MRHPSLNIAGTGAWHTSVCKIRTEASVVPVSDAILDDILEIMGVANTSPAESREAWRCEVGYALKKSFQVDWNALQKRGALAGLPMVPRSGKELHSQNSSG
jgi:hypothetical protein